MFPPPKILDKFSNRLASETKARLRLHILRSKPGLHSPQAVEHLYNETVRLARIDLVQAERLAKAAGWISRKIDDHSAKALGLRALGHIEYLRGRNEPAARLYREALAIYEALGKELEAGRTLSGGFLQTLSYLGRYDEAFAFAQRAREIFLKQGDALRLARLDANVANVLNRQDRFEEALEYYQRACAELARIGDPQDVAIALRNMATCQISMNEFPGARETYKQARQWCADHDMPLLAAEADYNIAYLYYLQGEYTRALDLYASTREHCRELGDQYHQGLCDLDQSEMYLELNLSEEGARLAQRALDTFRQLGTGYEAAKALTNLGIASSHRGDAEGALSLFRKARDLFIREQNDACTATVDLYQALVFLESGHLNEARVLCNRAFDYFRGSPLTGKAALCQLLLARAALNGGHPSEARDACLDSVARAETAQLPAVGCQAYFVLGLIEEALGNSQAAHKAYLKSHELLENLRHHLRAEGMKVAFLRNKLAVYEALVSMCLAKESSPGALERAFGYIEQAKSRTLADLIAFRASQIPAPRETRRVLVEQVGALREQLNWYGRTIQMLEGKVAGTGDARLGKLRRAAGECERRLAEAFANLRSEDQEFADLQAAGSIPLDAIRAAIPANAMLLQFYRVRDVFHACLLSRSSIKIAPVCPAADVRRSLQLLRFQLSKFRLGADYVRTFQPQLLEAANAHLQEFYKQLIAPIERLLDADHLIIAPHDFLHYLPFQALLDGDSYLGDRFSISYTPSASVFYLCSAKSEPPSEKSLVLGIPDPAAPQILDEVRAVSSVLPNPEVLVGKDATAEALRAKASGCRFIHIATHGRFRRDNPMFSSIGLGDSQLNLFDLYQLNMPAELVTLSGCGTGLNVVVGGDELLGLKRGLLYAGARAVLLTLWDVNDQSTAGFMKLFYERLKANPDKAKAAQYAMRETKRIFPHPFYWAPFILVGKYS